VFLFFLYLLQFFLDVVWQTAWMKGNRSFFNTAATHKVTVHIIKYFITVHIAVYIGGRPIISCRSSSLISNFRSMKPSFFEKGRIFHPKNAAIMLLKINIFIVTNQFAHSRKSSILILYSCMFNDALHRLNSSQMVCFVQ